MENLFKCRTLDYYEIGKDAVSMYQEPINYKPLRSTYKGHNVTTYGIRQHQLKS